MPSTTPHPRPGRATLTIALDAATGVAPSEVRFFRAGWNDTHKGEFLFDEKAAESVLAAFADWGLDALPFDYGHAMLDPKPVDPAESGKAAGWFRPEVRDGELWAVDIKWVGDVGEKVAAGEYRFTSPAFNFDDETRRITEIVNAAITNIPATKGAMALADRNEDTMKTLSRMTAAALAALSISFEEISRAVREALNAKYPPKEEGGMPAFWLCEMFDDNAIVEMEGKLFSIPYAYKDGAATLTGEPVEVRRTFEPVKSEAPAEEPAQAQLAAAPPATKVEGEPPAEEPKKEPAEPAPEISGRAAVCKALGLPDTATDEEMQAALEKLKAPKEEAPATATLSREASEKLARIEAERDAAKAELANMKEAETLARFVGEASQLKALPGTDLAQLGRDLMTLDAKAPEEGKRLRAALERAHAALSQSVLLEEKGRGGNVEAGSAYEEIDRRAGQLVTEAAKKGETLSREAARAKVTETDPALAKRYHDETAPRPKAA